MILHNSELILTRFEFDMRENQSAELFMQFPCEKNYIFLFF